MGEQRRDNEEAGGRSYQREISLIGKSLDVEGKDKERRWSSGGKGNEDGVVNEGVRFERRGGSIIKSGGEEGVRKGSVQSSTVRWRSTRVR